MTENICLTNEHFTSQVHLMTQDVCLDKRCRSTETEYFLLLLQFKTEWFGFYDKSTHFPWCELWPLLQCHTVATLLLLSPGGWSSWQTWSWFHRPWAAMNASWSPVQKLVSYLVNWYFNFWFLITDFCFCPVQNWLLQFPTHWLS